MYSSVASLSSGRSSGRPLRASATDLYRAASESTWPCIHRRFTLARVRAAARARRWYSASTRRVTRAKTETEMTSSHTSGCSIATRYFAK